MGQQTEIQLIMFASPSNIMQSVRRNVHRQLLANNWSYIILSDELMCHSQEVNHQWHSGSIEHGLIGYSGVKVFDVALSPQKAGVP